MKRILFLIILFALTILGETLFEVKDASNNPVLNVSTDGLRILNQGDTLMVISTDGIRAYIQQDASKGLSRAFSVTTTQSKGDQAKGQSRVFEIATDNGATFYNPSDNTDEIFNISKGGITANVNPALNRDFEVNDQVSSKGSGNLMKISNESVFEVVNDSTMLWYKDKNAFRIGYVYINDPNTVGQGSFASGYKSQAGGKFSTALGYWAQASGDNAFASGKTSMATGENAGAIGNEAYASGMNSFAIGYNTEASGASSFAGGSLSSASGLNSCAIGAVCSASDEYANAIGALCVANKYGATAVGMGAWATGQNSTAVGVGAKAENTYSTSVGRLTTAAGYGSTAIGYQTSATDYYATALGYSTVASDNYATALGRSNTASGYNSTAMGYNSEATGYYSTAIGYGIEARPYCSFIVGRFNSIGGSSTSWVPGDALFIVGNGESDISRSNAFKVEKDGGVFAPEAYVMTSSYSKKDLKVDSRGLLCVLSKEEKGYDDEDVVELIRKNEELSMKVEDQNLRIAKLEEALEKLLK